MNRGPIIATAPVSYTHLDVYKRQGQCCVMNKNIKHCEDFAGDFQVVFFMFQDVFLEQLMTEYGEEALTADSLSEVNPIYQLYLDSRNRCV